jgi:hypothetical protein
MLFRVCIGGGQGLHRLSSRFDTQHVCPCTGSPQMFQDSSLSRDSQTHDEIRPVERGIRTKQVAHYQWP